MNYEFTGNKEKVNNIMKKGLKRKVFYHHLSKQEVDKFYNSIIIIIHFLIEGIEENTFDDLLICQHMFNPLLNELLPGEKYDKLITISKDIIIDILKNHKDVTVTEKENMLLVHFN